MDTTQYYFLAYILLLYTIEKKGLSFKKNINGNKRQDDILLKIHYLYSEYHCVCIDVNSLY